MPTKWYGRAIGLLLLLSVVGLLYSSTFFKFNKGEHKTQTFAVQTNYATHFGWPVRNAFDYDFGHRGANYLTPSNGVYHPGIDVNLSLGSGDADLGNPVISIAAGTVVYAGNAGGTPDKPAYGNTVIIEHTLPDNSLIWSLYAHLNSITVSKDATVKLGDQVGTIGQSGYQDSPHLHWEIRTVSSSEKTWPVGLTIDEIEDRYVNPFNFVRDFNFFYQITDHVTLFEGTYFRGNYENYYPGYTDMVAFESGLINNASSIAIPPGWSVNLYNNPGQTAHAELFSSDVKLSDNNSSGGGSIDNAAQAVKVFTSSQCTPGLVSAASVTVANNCNPDPSPSNPPGSQPPPNNPPQQPTKKVILFTGKGYTNAYYELEVGNWDVDNREYGSVSVPSGYSFILVDSHDGHESCYDRSLDNLTDHESWQFNIDAVVVVDQDVCSSNGGSAPPEPLGNADVRYWTEPGYQGSSTKVTFISPQNIYWLNDFHWQNYGGVDFNDKIQSFELNTSNNRSMALYRDDGLQGPAKCFSGSDDNLNNDVFNDGNIVAKQASSARFFIGTGCDLRPLAPMELWVQDAQKGKVVLTWPRGGPDDDGYYVYLYDGSTYQRVATLTWNDAQKNAQDLGLDPMLRAFTWTGALCGGQYTFVVASWNEFGESPHTHTVTANTPKCDCNDVTTQGVGLYQTRLCQDAHVDVTVPGWYTLNNFNDQTSSIYIKPGWSAEVFQNYSASDGYATCMTESKWDLSLDKYWPDDVVVDKTISNVRVFDTPNCGRQLPPADCGNLNYNGIALFDYKVCEGQDRLFNQPGFYNLYDFDNQASSIFIKPGWSVRVYQENTREGKYVCFNDSKWDLSQDPYWRTDQKAGNDITSIEVFTDTLCGGVSMPRLNQPENTTDQTDLTLFWQPTYPEKYWIELWGPDGYFFHTDVGTPEVHIGVQKAGFYSLRLAADAMGHLSQVATMTYTIASTAPPQQMTVSYTADPTMINRITFYTSNCSGQWVHVVFGDGNETDSPCQNTSSTTQHDYSYSGVAVTYNALVGGIPVTVNIGAPTPDKDCSSVGLQAGVSLFDQINCKGDKRTFTAVGSYSLSDFNDLASAIVIAPNWSVEVFKNTTSSDGNAYCVTRNVWDLSKQAYYGDQGGSMDNDVSNIRVYSNPTCGKTQPQYGGCGANINFEGIILFDYFDCGGTEFSINQPGKFELGYGGQMNDLTSSIHVAPGWSLKVYQDNGQKGLVSCYASDMWKLETDKYWQSNVIVGNTISSLEVFHDAVCGANQQPPQPTKLAAPKNLSPNNQEFKITTDQVDVDLHWDGVTNAQSYKVQVKNSAGVVVFDKEVTQLAAKVVGAKVGKYSWTVQASSSDTHYAVSDQASATFIVSILPPQQQELASPSNLSPLGVMITEGSATLLTWTGVINAEKYSVKIESSAGVTTSVVSRTTLNAGLLAPRRYEWSVTALPAQGSNFTQSDPATGYFWISPKGGTNPDPQPPAAPTELKPVGQQSEKLLPAQYTLGWKASSGTDHYEVKLTPPDETEQDIPPVATTQSVITVVKSGLFHWRVRAVGVNGLASVWVEASFIVPAPTTNPTPQVQVFLPLVVK